MIKIFISLFCFAFSIYMNDAHSMKGRTKTGEYDSVIDQKKSNLLLEKQDLNSTMEKEEFHEKILKSYYDKDRVIKELNERMFLLLKENAELSSKLKELDSTKKQLGDLKYKFGIMLDRYAISEKSLIESRGLNIALSQQIADYERINILERDDQDKSSLNEFDQRSQKALRSGQEIHDFVDCLFKKGNSNAQTQQPQIQQSPLIHHQVFQNKEPKSQGFFKKEKSNSQIQQSMIDFLNKSQTSYDPKGFSCSQKLQQFE